jgi:rSAM/selenodomain-associated transferase 1
MSKKLVLVFIKNAVPGKVKTRLAKDLGNDLACDIYKKLLSITDQAISNVACDSIVYYGETIENEGWDTSAKKVQSSGNLGDRMLHAFTESFAVGYEQVIIVGSDLPDLSSEIISDAFAKLNDSDLVIGPAEDGGYYLLGQKAVNTSIYEDMPWSQENLLEITLGKLKQENKSVALLQPLNDVDNIEDLKKSSLYNEVKSLLPAHL